MVNIIQFSAARLQTLRFHSQSRQGDYTFNPAVVVLRIKLSFAFS